MHQGFKVGDFIEATPNERDKGTDKDFGVLRGTALDERSQTGYSAFRIRLNGTDQIVLLNLNYVDVKTLFRVGQ